MIRVFNIVQLGFEESGYTICKMLSLLLFLFEIREIWDELEYDKSEGAIFRPKP